MFEEILNGFQCLHFDILTLSPTKVNWVERWSKVGIISLIRLTMWVLSTKDLKTQLGLTQWSLRMFDNGLKKIKNLLITLPHA